MEEMMFQVGDFMVYSSTGVCQVEALCRPNLTGQDKNDLYYQLKPLYQDGVIYVPIENSKVAIRPLIPYEEAEELYSLIPSLHVEIYRAPTTQALTQYYQMAIHSHDCRKLAEMVLSIHAKRQQAEAQNRRLGLVDERYLKQAERLLCGELSIVLHKDYEEMQSYIANIACGEEVATVYYK